MADLSQATPGAGHFPLQSAGSRAVEAPWASLHAVFPLAGHADAVRGAFGGWPEPNRWIDADGRRLAFSGRGQAFVLGELPGGLEGAAVAAQSDAWCRVHLSGPAAAEVLARLTPVDVAAMAPGEAARTLLGHMSAHLLREEAGWELMVFRSMAGTLAHDLGRAMRMVAARRAAS